MKIKIPLLIIFILSCFSVYAENEPNNSAAQANSLEPDGTVTGNLSGSDTKLF